MQRCAKPERDYARRAIANSNDQGRRTDRVAVPELEEGTAAEVIVIVNSPDSASPALPSDPIRLARGAVASATGTDFVNIVRDAWHYGIQSLVRSSISTRTSIQSRRYHWDAHLYLQALFAVLSSRNEDRCDGERVAGLPASNGRARAPHPSVEARGSQSRCETLCRIAAPNTGASASLPGMLARSLPRLRTEAISSLKDAPPVACLRARVL